MKTASSVLQILFGAVIGANILSMSLLNFFEAPIQYLLPVYLVCMVIIGALMARYIPVLPVLSRREHYFCAGLAVLIFLPRLAYLAEGLLGYAAAFTCYDDAQHLQHLSSIVGSTSFPPRSTFDASQYLNYYYAPWMLGAAVYLTGLLSTVKQALALTVLVYCFFFTYGVMYISRLLFSQTRLQNVFLFTCVLYGGFDFFYWLSTLSIVPRHSEWWALRLGFQVQYSNFFTLVLWVQQHTLAALTILYTLFFLARSRSLVAQALAGIFFLSTIFSSAFVALGAAPLAAWWYFRNRQFSSGTLVTVFFFLLFSIPLWWIYLGKSTEHGFQPFGELNAFWMERKPLAFLMFVLILCLEFMPIFASAWIAVRRQRHTNSIVTLTLSLLVLISTFFVAFTIGNGQLGNNYPMRASIVPIFTLIYLGTPVLSEWLDALRPDSARTITLRTLIAAYFLGAILEYTSFSRSALTGLATSSTSFNSDVLRFNQGDPRVNGADLAERATLKPLSWYLLERDRPTKPDINQHDIASMGRDNRYRVSISTISALHAR